MLPIYELSELTDKGSILNDDIVSGKCAGMTIGVRMIEPLTEITYVVMAIADNRFKQASWFVCDKVSFIVMPK